MHEPSSVTYQETRTLKTIVAFLPSEGFVSGYLTRNRELSQYSSLGTGESTKHLTLSQEKSLSALILMALGDREDDDQMSQREEDKSTRVRVSAIEKAMRVLRAIVL